MSTPVETSEPVLTKLPDIVYKTWWPLVEQKFREFHLSLPINWQEGIDYVEQSQRHSLYIEEFAFLFTKDYTTWNLCRNFLLKWSILHPAFTVKILADEFFTMYSHIKYSTINRTMRRLCHLMVRRELINSYSMNHIKIKRFHKVAVYHCHWVKDRDFVPVNKEYERYALNTGNQTDDDTSDITPEEIKEQVAQKMQPVYEGMREAGKRSKANVPVQEVVAQKTQTNIVNYEAGRRLKEYKRQYHQFDNWKSFVRVKFQKENCIQDQKRTWKQNLCGHCWKEWQKKFDKSGNTGIPWLDANRKPILGENNLRILLRQDTIHTHDVIPQVLECKKHAKMVQTSMDRIQFEAQKINEYPAGLELDVTLFQGLLEGTSPSLQHSMMLEEGGVKELE